MEFVEIVEQTQPGATVHVCRATTDSQEPPAPRGFQEVREVGSQALAKAMKNSSQSLFGYNKDWILTLDKAAAPANLPQSSERNGKQDHYELWTLNEERSEGRGEELCKSITSFRMCLPVAERNYSRGGVIVPVVEEQKEGLKSDLEHQGKLLLYPQWGEETLLTCVSCRFTVY